MACVLNAVSSISVVHSLCQQRTHLMVCRAARCGVAVLVWQPGPWGLHHLYLDRPDHCFLWLTTFGGFGFGSMRDVWRIPSYVRAANFDAKHMRVSAGCRAYSVVGFS